MSAGTRTAPVVAAPAQVRPRAPMWVPAAGAAVLAATTFGSLGRPAVVTALVAAGAALAVGVTVLGVRRLLGPGAPAAATAAAAVLSVLGCLTAERVSPGTGVGQAAALVVGLATFLLVVRTAGSPRLWPAWMAPAATAVALGMLGLALVPGLGNDVGGAQVGVMVAGVPVQASEPARPLLAAVFAARWATSVDLLRRSKHPYRQLVIAGAPLAGGAVLLVLAGDRGPLLVIGLTAVILVLWARPGLRVALAALGAPAVLTAVALLASSTMRERVAQMADPDADGLLTNLGAGLRSFARGGWFGTGVGHGHPEAVRFAGSDFVLTHLAEERGAIGALVVIGLLAVVVRGAWVAVAPLADPVRRTVGLAMVLLIAVQSVYTCAGVLGVVPLTGMTLPFVSRGGSSMIALWMTLGVSVGLGVGRRVTTVESSTVSVRRVCDGAFAAIAALLVGVVLAPPVPAGTSIDVDWARHRGPVLAADGTVLARTAADGSRRDYPMGPAFADVVGFTEPGVGAGIEDSDRARMSCTPTWWERAVGSDCTPPAVVTALRPQAQAAAVAGLAGRTGDVVAIDLATHGLVAAWSSPRPGVEGPGYATLPSSPGSVFKLVTATAALDAGVDTETPVRSEYTAPGGTRPVRNAGGVPGGGRLETALAESSNTAFGEIATRTGAGPLAATTARLLTWQGPPVVEPATAGPAPDSPDALTRTGFGQEGVRVTPMSLAVLAGEVADGQRIAPRSVVGTCTADDGYVGDPAPTGESVIPVGTRSRLRTAMTTVAQEIPALAALPGGAAAKTGTAERPDGSTDGLVVAFAPVDHPRVAVAVRMDAAPGASRSGGVDAGPVAAAVLRAAEAPAAGSCAGP